MDIVCHAYDYDITIITIFRFLIAVRLLDYCIVD